MIQTRRRRPAGQTFIPAGDHVNVIELHVGSDDGLAGSGVFAVHVRADSIGGAILGTSAPRTLSGPSNAKVPFIFGTPVDVDPGRKYVFEIYRASGEANIMIYGNDPSTYANGDAVLLGIERSALDFWFRLGFDDETPVVPISWSSLKWRHR